jgi:hypothetical protein
VGTFQALSSVKSPQEILQLQTKLASSALERTLADTGRIGDAAIKLIEQTLAPLAAKAGVTVEKFSKPFA